MRVLAHQLTTLLPLSMFILRLAACSFSSAMISVVTRPTKCANESSGGGSLRLLTTLETYRAC